MGLTPAVRLTIMPHVFLTWGNVMRSIAVRALLLSSICVVSSAAWADDPFTVDLTVGANPPVHEGFKAIADLADQFSDAQLQQSVPGYTPTSAASGVVNLRGLAGVSLSYPAASPDLTLSIPSLGINQTFVSRDGTRQDSRDQLKDWFKGAGADQLKRLQTELAAQSPIDPVAGNPNSLMAQMVGADFGAATGALGAGKMGFGAEGSKNLFGVAARFGRYTQNNFDATVLSVPLSYTHLLSSPGYALSFDLPLTYIDNNGAKSGSASLGVGLRIPVAERWSLVPALRAGVVASADLGAGSLLYSGGVTSDYQLPSFSDKFNIGIANMIAVYKTGALKVGDYKTGYELENYVFRNGVLLDGEPGWTSFESLLRWEFQIVHTDYTGTRLYSRSSTDFAASIGTRRQSGALVWNALRLGVTYTVGPGKISGAQVNFGYVF